MLRLLCCCLLFSHLVFAKELVTIAVGEWSPYISGKLKYQGVVGRIVRNAFALEGIDIALISLKLLVLLFPQLKWANKATVAMRFGLLGVPSSGQSPCIRMTF